VPNIQRLNNRVAVTAVAGFDTHSSAELHTLLSAHDIVIATDQPFPALVALNAACRASHRRFYAASCHGFYGFIFADLIRHEFVVERVLANVGTLLGPEAGSQTRSVVQVDVRTEDGRRVERVTKEEIYTTLDKASESPLPPSVRNLRRRMRAVSPLLSCFRALWDMEARRAAAADASSLSSSAHSTSTMTAPSLVSALSATSVSSADLHDFIATATRKHRQLNLGEDSLTSELIRKFLDNLGSQLAPITAIVGGLVAQDVINVVGAREQPIQNLALFDGESFQVPVYAMHEEDFGLASGVANGELRKGVVNGVVGASGSLAASMASTAANSAEIIIL
jgi:ubiquitin-like 1-activating enzyme E1 A